MADRKSAAQIMKKKGFIKAEIERQMPKAQSDALWEKATEKLGAILEHYDDLPRGFRAHTDMRIFPSAAVYLTAKERLGQKTAFGIVENAAVGLTDSLGRKLKGLMRLPGMRGLFIRGLGPRDPEDLRAEQRLQESLLSEKEGRIPDGCPRVPLLPIFQRARLPGADQDLL